MGSVEWPPTLEFVVIVSLSSISYRGCRGFMREGMCGGSERPCAWE